MYRRMRMHGHQIAPQISEDCIVIREAESQRKLGVSLCHGGKRLAMSVRI